MRLTAFTDRSQRSPFQWGIIALLSAIGVTAEAGWLCSEQPNGLWECITPPAAEIVPAEDDTFTIEDTDTDVGELVAPAATVPATLDTVDTPVTSDTTGTPEALAAKPPGIESPDTPNATPATEPAATSSPVTTVPPQTAKARSHLIPQAKKMGRSREQDMNIDRWALCPPLPQSPANPPSTNPDEIDLRADSAQASDNNVYTLDGNATVLYGPQRLGWTLQPVLLPALHSVCQVTLCQAVSSEAPPACPLYRL
jgi:hypothetical protein